MFNLASVVLDPYTNESSWILKTASRILAGFSGADVRVNFIVACDQDQAQEFLGPLAQDFLVFCDPERTMIKNLGVSALPAFVFLQMNGEVAASAEGWNASEWRKVAAAIAKATAWSQPGIPATGDPAAFKGTPALV